ncbi:vesicle-associated membrane protein 7-like [Helicoverpa zea]|uniref:vesicle-associated membrane protein 7-like n=1 Tax=Helicoverpa zea TaxID=7113 RepID=UPI001F58F2A9|nr:vesicle-associated membrane protein 7-like [Helicoverpa zea]
MPIVFSAVSYDRNIVANFASCDGNFTEIAECVLSKLPACNNKMTYSHGVYLLHYIAEDNYLYFCITDKLCQRSRAFLFLNEIQRRFITSKQTMEDFTTVLANEMYRYSEDYSTIVIRKGELDELNSIGVGCSESILGEKILYINNPDIISYSTVTHVSATPGLLSISGVCPTPEGINVANTTSQIILTSEEASDKTKEVRTSLTTDRISNAPLNTANTSLLSPLRENVPVISPRLYIVIIGVIMLVIAMSVYALGPISCVVVTGIGIYSLIRSYANSKDKLE